METKTADQIDPAAAAPAADMDKIKSLLNLPQTATDIDVIQTMAAVIANLQEQYDNLQADYTAIRGQDVQNRMEQFADVITPATEDYWREQILVNRDGAIAALTDLAEVLKNRAPDAPALAIVATEKCAACGGDMTGDICNKCGAKKGAMKNEAPAAPAPAPAAQPPEPLRNRIAAEVRPVSKLADQPAGDAAEAAAISNRAREIQKAKPGTPWVDAFATAEKEYLK